MIETIDEARYEVAVILEEALADNPEIEVSASDAVSAACGSIEDDSVALELCRIELGVVPSDLEHRLGRKDWLDS